MPKDGRQKPSGRSPLAEGRSTSSLGRDVYRRTLDRYLSRAADEGFFRMAWAVDAIHTDRASYARKCGFKFPDELATRTLTVDRVYHWELETLINELLIVPKEKELSGRQLRLDCGKYASARVWARALQKLENAEDRGALDHVGVISEMHRLTQRYQRGKPGHSAHSTPTPSTSILSKARGMSIG